VIKYGRDYTCDHGEPLDDQGNGIDCAKCTKPVETFGAIKLSEMIVPRIVGRYRWCKALGWLYFDGACWSMDADTVVWGEVVAAVKAYTRKLLEESPTGLTLTNLKELATFSSGAVQSHALKLARAAPGVLTSVATFDRLPEPGAPWLLPCSNGYTVELFPDGRTKVRRTSPDDLNTHVACAYDPDAVAPTAMEAFCKYQPDESVRTYLLQTWARGMSGMGMEKFLVNLGERGGNGKSTMEGVLTEVAGDYAAQLPVEVIVKGRGAAREVYRSELAQMRGARLVFCDEPEEGAQYNLGMLKKITGGGALQGRHMGKEAITFHPRILFQMSSNNRPSWSADGGMKRRYVEVSWDYVVKAGDLRESFKEELKAEASGFLNVVLSNWMGADPVEVPDAIQRQTERGEAESSPAAKFVTEAIRKSAGGFVSSRRMYDAYAEWAKQNGIRNPISSTKLGRELPRLGLERKHTESGNVWQNVDVVEEYVRTAF